MGCHPRGPRPSGLRLGLPSTSRQPVSLITAAGLLRAHDSTAAAARRVRPSRRKGCRYAGPDPATRETRPDQHREHGRLGRHRRPPIHSLHRSYRHRRLTATTWATTPSSPPRSSPPSCGDNPTVGPRSTTANAPHRVGCIRPRSRASHRSTNPSWAPTVAFGELPE